MSDSYNQAFKVKDISKQNFSDSILSNLNNYEACTIYIGVIYVD